MEEVAHVDDGGALLGECVEVLGAVVCAVGEGAPGWEFGVEVGVDVGLGGACVAGVAADGDGEHVRLRGAGFGGWQGGVGQRLGVDCSLRAFNWVCLVSIKELC